MILDYSVFVTFGIPYYQNSMSSSTLLDTIRATRALSESEFLGILQQSGKYKLRSETTHDLNHVPTLFQIPNKPIKCLLLGDSMLEHFITTGRDTRLGSLSFPDVFNAGVGGDRIHNILFRLGVKDLYSLLKPHGVKLVILQMGTNDLKPNRGFIPDALVQYALVMETMRRLASGSIKIIVTGLMPRKDVGQEFIDTSNEKLRALVEYFNSIQIQDLRQGQLYK